MTQGEAANMPRGSHRAKENWMGPQGFTDGQTECQGRVLWWVPSGKAEPAEGGPPPLLLLHRQAGLSRVHGAGR